MKLSGVICTLVMVFFAATGICHAQAAAQEDYKKGVSLGADGKFDEARTELEHALKADPYNITFRKYLLILDDLKAKKINDSVALLLFKGTHLGDTAKPDEALVEFDKAIAATPDYDPAYTCRGLIHIDKGALEKAIDDYTKAIELNPKNAEAYNTRGFVRTIRSESSKALADFTKAIEINSQMVEAYQNRGLIYMMQEDIEPACADWKKACELGQCYNLQMAVVEGQCQQTGQ